MRLLEHTKVKRIVDEQYQRGMKLLRDNMYLLDELAKMLMEQEKVSGMVWHFLGRYLFKSFSLSLRCCCCCCCWTSTRRGHREELIFNVPKHVWPSLVFFHFWAIPKSFASGTVRGRTHQADQQGSDWGSLGEYRDYRILIVSYSLCRLTIFCAFCDSSPIAIASTCSVVSHSGHKTCLKYLGSHASRISHPRSSLICTSI